MSVRIPLYNSVYNVADRPFQGVINKIDGCVQSKNFLASQLLTRITAVALIPLECVKFLFDMCNTMIIVIGGGIKLGVHLIRHIHHSETLYQFEESLPGVRKFKLTLAKTVFVGMGIFTSIMFGLLLSPKFNLPCHKKLKDWHLWLEKKEVRQGDTPLAL